MLKTAAAFVASLLLPAACAAPLSKHPVTPATLGEPVSKMQVLASLEKKSEAQLEKIKVADWRFPRRYVDPGEIDQPGKYKIQTEDFEAEVYIYVLHHPTQGLYLIDAGFPKDHEAAYGFFLRRAVRRDGSRLVIHRTTADWLTAHADEPLKAVFVTHLHFDHVQGITELDPAIPVFAGPGAGTRRHVYNRFIAKPTRLAFKDRPPLEEWSFAAPEPGAPALLDVFGDGTLFAIHVPGHTPGSTAFLVNAADGAHLITGDAVHTMDGWVGPTLDASAFKTDLEQSWESASKLQRLAREIPHLTVHPGHQSF